MGLFQKPLYLLWLALLLGSAAALHFWAQRRRARALAAFGLPVTVGRLFSARAVERRGMKALLQLAAACLLFAALAGPQWGVELVTQEAQGIQALLAVDVSLSMQAEDAKPSRIAKAKSELLQLLDGLKGERIGLVAFAGAAHVVCPLTTDVDAAKSLLDTLQVGMVPQPGTAVGDVLRLGARLLGRYPGHKALVLLTDGEDRAGNPMEAAREAAAAGVRVFIIGVGTPEGVPIPLRDAGGRTTGYLKDINDRTVVSKLAEPGLIRIAAAASGAYYRATPDEGEAQAILKHVLELEKSRIQAGSANLYKNRYRFPLALAVLLLFAELLLGERPLERWTIPRRLENGGRKSRRDVAPSHARLQGIGLALSAALLSGCGQAQTALDLWRGNRKYKAGEIGRSLEHYAQANRRSPRDPRPVFNGGDAQYKLGQFEEAQQAYSAVAETGQAPKPLRTGSLYNLGNARYRKGEYKEAAQAYKRCLLLDPSYGDCRFNLVKALAAIQNPPPKQNQPKSCPNPQQDKKQEPQSRKSPPDRPRPKSGMTQEDADRILQAVKEREKGVSKPKPASRYDAGKAKQVIDW